MTPAERLAQVERIRETWKGNAGYAATLDIDIAALRLLVDRSEPGNSELSHLINALPERLRRYIHHLETDADPADTLRENFRLREENAGLRVECEKFGQALRDIAEIYAHGAVRIGVDVDVPRIVERALST